MEVFSRCPYCQDGSEFRLMIERYGGAWSRCDQCGHVVIRGQESFDCCCVNCLKQRSEAQTYRFDSRSRILYGPDPLAPEPDRRSK
jgi:hypothetical protein